MGRAGAEATKTEETPWTAVSFLVGLIIGTVFVAILFTMTEDHVPDCLEDENWIAVDHHEDDAVEDQHGVSRACRNWED